MYLLIRIAVFYSDWYVIYFQIEWSNEHQHSKKKKNLQQIICLIAKLMSLILVLKLFWKRSFNRFERVWPTSVWQSIYKPKFDVDIIMWYANFAIHIISWWDAIRWQYFIIARTFLVYMSVCGCCMFQFYVFTVK